MDGTNTLDTPHKEANFKDKLKHCSDKELDELYKALSRKFGGKTNYKSLKYFESIIAVIGDIHKQVDANKFKDKTN